MSDSGTPISLSIGPPFNDGDGNVSQGVGQGETRPNGGGLSVSVRQGVEPDVGQKRTLFKTPRGTTGPLWKIIRPPPRKRLWFTLCGR